VRGLAQLAQELDEALGCREALAQFRAACPQRKAAVHLFQCRQQAFASFDGAATAGADRPQRQPLAVVAQKPGPQPGAQE
jgi:hypothetical protein